MTSKPLELPGFGLPVNHQGLIERFPNAIVDWAGVPATVRERTMVALMDSITDKPEWDRKVFQEDIVHKWRQEAVDSGMDVSEKMLDWVCRAKIIDFRHLGRSFSFRSSCRAEIKSLVHCFISPQ